MSDHENDWLRIGLTEIANKANANKATVPNLSHGAVQISRQMTRVRTFAAAAAVIVVLGAAGLGALTWGPRQHQPPIPPATASPTPSASAGPTPTTSPSPHASVSGTPTNGAPVVISGTLYYVDRAVVHAVTERVDRVLRLTFDDGECPSQSIVVSPDGHHIGWVKTHPDANSTLVGDLMVSSIDGSGARLLVAGVSCLGSSPEWTVDSKEMYFRPSSDTSGTNPWAVNITTGKNSPAPNGYSHRSPNGQFLVSGGKTGITITRADGSGPRTFTYQPPNDTEHSGLFSYGSWYAAGISNSGVYVSIRHGGSDPTRSFDDVCVVDSRTGKDLHLPGTGTLTRVVFLDNGRMLLERLAGDQRRLFMTSADGQLLAQADVPTATQGALLTYVP